MCRAIICGIATGDIGLFLFVLNKSQKSLRKFTRSSLPLVFKVTNVAATCYEVKLENQTTLGRENIVFTIRICSAFTSVKKLNFCCPSTT